MTEFQGAQIVLRCKTFDDYAKALVKVRKVFDVEHPLVRLCVLTMKSMACPNPDFSYYQAKNYVERLVKRS